MTAATAPAPEAPGLVRVTEPGLLATGEVPTEERLRDVPVAVWLVLAALVANVFSGNSDKLGLPISLDRVLFPAAMVLIVLEPRRPVSRLRPLHLLMVLFTMATIFSATLAGTLTKVAPMFALLDRVIMPFLLFVTVPLVMTTPKRRRLLLGTLTGIGAYLSVVTFLEGAGVPQLAWPRYIGAWHAAEALKQTGEVVRAGGPFLAAEANGQALAMCGIAALLLARRSTGASRMLASVIGPVAMVASVLSMTRSVWLGLGLALVAIVILNRPLWRFVPWALGALAVVAVLVVVLLPSLTDSLLERGTMSSSLYDRQNTNAAALRVLADRPLEGVGWGEFVHEGSDWVRQDPTYPLTNVNIEVHNVFLSRAAEIGIPAALLFVAIVVGGPVAAALRRLPGRLDDWRMAFLGVFLVWLTASMTSPNPYPMPTYLMWIFAGIVAQLALTARIDAHREGESCP